MRSTLYLFALMMTMQIWAKPGPDVPSTIEIAGVKLKITADAQREIQKDVDALHVSEKYLQIKVDRANLYFPIIERILKEEGVPEDIKYLALQESGLVSDQVSSANAVGYWQFKDFTAREVGLRVDKQVDERKNVVAATRGAATYFKRNNYFLKNWIYSVNAYLTGPTGVKKYVDKSEMGSNKMTIDKKTHWYVKRYIAHVIAFKDEVGGGHSEGLKLGEYTKGKNQTLDEIAKDLKVDADLLKDYNKWLNHGKVPDDKTYTVIVPTTGRIPSKARETPEKESNDPPPLTRHIQEPKEKEKPSTFGAAYESKSIFIKRNGLKAVMAAESDNMVSLALKANILSRQLMKYNDLGPTQTLVKGEVYYVQRKRSKAAIENHVAQPDETLWEISQKYGVKLKNIYKMNRMSPSDELKAGRVLWLQKKRPKDLPIEYKEVKKVEKAKPRKELINPPVRIPTKTVAKEIEIREEDEPDEEIIEEVKAPESVEVNATVHEVQPGESLWSISRKYGVTIEELTAWNQLTDNNLHIGQELTLSASQNVKNEPKPEAPKASTTYLVQPGDTLYGIARKFEISVDKLKKLNGKTANELAVGEELKVGE